jgi:hypothetical protein
VDGQLGKAIVEGVVDTGMTSYEGAFEEAQLSDLVAHIRSLRP